MFFFFHKPHAGRRMGRKKMPFLTMVTLTFDPDFKTRPSEGQTRLLCEFGTSPFTGSRGISYTNKKSQTTPKTEPYAVHIYAVHCVR